MNIVVRDQILRLQAEAAKLPQVEIPTNHYFTDGMYCRESRVPAGTVVVGRVHKKDHIFVMVKGMASLTVGETVELAIAPMTFISHAGVKRAAYTHEDCIFLTVHRTDATTVEEAEADISEEDPTSMYTTGNELKNKLTYGEQP